MSYIENGCDLHARQLRRLATTEPLTSRSGLLFRQANLVGIGSIVRFPTKQVGADAGIAPRLGRLTWTVTSPPSGHSAIVHGPQVLHRHSRDFRPLRQRLRLRKQLIPLNRIGRPPFCLGILVRLESDVRLRVLPVERTELLDLPFTRQSLFPREPAVVFGRP